MINIEVTGAKELVAKLGKMAGLTFFKAALKAGGVYLKGKISIPPGVNRLSRAEVYGDTWKGGAQRRFFFGALMAGIIDVPYVRNQSAGSQGLTKRWTVKASDGGMTVTVGNNAGYGALVHGEVGEQSRYLAAVGWRPASTVAEEEGPVIVRQIDEAVRKECEK
ncbi:MAG: hypothetical protein C0391_03880 [Anaerolinea sp.]|nr:hypothetical protein [Anaerolinea sp.]